MVIVVMAWVIVPYRFDNFELVFVSVHGHDVARLIQMAIIGFSALASPRSMFFANASGDVIATVVVKVVLGGGFSELLWGLLLRIQRWQQ